MDEDRVMNLFFDLVSRPSPSLHERPVAQFCADYLHNLGMTVHIDDASSTIGADTGNLIATLPGMPGLPSLLLSAHMDTVERPGDPITPRMDDQGVIWSDGSTVLGADDKAGITAVIGAIEQITCSSAPHGPITVVLTVAEEQGFSGSKHLRHRGVTADVGLVLDYSGPPGSFVTASPAQARFEVVVERPALTSFNAHHKTQSVIQVATSAVAAMPRGWIDRDTRVSVVSFQRLGVDGERVQLVGLASSQSDFKLERVLAQTEALFRATADTAGATVRFKVQRLCDSFEFASHDPVRQRIEFAIERTGLTPDAVVSREASDANVFTSLGIPTINLGIGYEDMHTSAEHIRLSDIVLATQIAYYFCCLE